MKALLERKDAPPQGKEKAKADETPLQGKEKAEANETPPQGKEKPPPARSFLKHWNRLVPCVF